MVIPDNLVPHALSGYVLHYIMYYIYLLYLYIYFSNSNTDVLIYSRLCRLCFNFGSAISYARKSYLIIQRKCRHRIKSPTTCTKMLRFCRKYVNGENERFCHGFYPFILQSLCVQLIVHKKFSAINGIFSKMYHQVAR